MRNPGFAAVLSPIIPGAGRISNGRILANPPWLIVTPGLRIVSGGLPGWNRHAVALYTAYSYARDRRVRL